MFCPPPSVPLFPYTTLFRSQGAPATALFNTSFTVAATASSGLPVVVVASGACSISGGTVLMTNGTGMCTVTFDQPGDANYRSEEHTSELQSLRHLVCRLLLE